MAKGRKTGGRQKGTRNKSTNALLGEAEAITLKLGEEIGSENLFHGDSLAFFKAIYKNETLPLGLRFQAADRIARFENPAKSSVDATINEQREYVARLPERRNNVDEWMATYGPPKGQG